MKRAVWLTDLHLAAAETELVANLLSQIKREEPECLFVTGDISDGDAFLEILPTLAECCSEKVYFVLGNHDFYGHGIRENRAKAVELAKQDPRLVYLTHETTPHSLGETALVGHDGWCDGRVGDFMGSSIRLNDFVLIEELQGKEPADLLSVLEALGQEAADHLEKQLLKAFDESDRAIVLCHTPPVREAARYDDQGADDEWAPHFVCGAIGNMLEQVMMEKSEKQLLYLCGHAHHGADLHLLPNCHIITGHTKTGIPRVQQTFEIV